MNISQSAFNALQTVLEEARTGINPLDETLMLSELNEELTKRLAAQFEKNGITNNSALIQETLKHYFQERFIFSAKPKLPIFNFFAALYINRKYLYAFTCAIFVVVTIFSLLRRESVTNNLEAISADWSSFQARNNPSCDKLNFSTQMCMKHLDEVKDHLDEGNNALSNFKGGDTKELEALFSRNRSSTLAAVERIRELTVADQYLYTLINSPDFAKNSKKYPSLKAATDAAGLAFNTDRSPISIVADLRQIQDTVNVANAQEKEASTIVAAIERLKVPRRELTGMSAAADRAFAAIKDLDNDAAEKALEKLQYYQKLAGEELDLIVITRDGLALTANFNTAAIEDYYLLVQAVAKNGEIFSFWVNETDDSSSELFGISVSPEVYESALEGKLNLTIASKAKGRIAFTYKIAPPGKMITEW